MRVSEPSWQGLGHFETSDVPASSPSSAATARRRVDSRRPRGERGRACQGRCFRRIAHASGTAILIVGVCLLVGAVVESSPASAQSRLPRVAIKAPTTSLTSPSTAPAADEGDTLTWTVTRTGSTANELTVPLTWRKAGGGHYSTYFEFTETNPQVTSVTFSANASEVEVSVDTDDDDLWERNTILLVCVSDLRDDGAGVTYQADDPFACAGFTLTNDDLPPLVTIAADQTTVDEGGRARFTLSRPATDANIPERVWLVYQRVDSSGNVTNYSLPQSISFQASQTTKRHSLLLRDNDTRSDDDFFTLRVRISNPQPAQGAPSGTYRVSNSTRQVDVSVVDDDLPRVSVSANASQSEGDPVVFTFTRLDATREPLTVDLTWIDSGGYLPSVVPSEITFEPNELMKTLSLSVDDGVDEMDGGIILQMSTTEEYEIVEESQSTTVLLTDDDEPQIITLQRDDTSIVEGEDATFTLTRQFETEDSLAATGQALEWPLVVNVAVTDQGDFIDGTEPSSVTFAAGSATATLTVPTDDDARPGPLEDEYDTAPRFHSAYENDGSITATVSAGTNYTAGLPAEYRSTPNDAEDTATVSIEDNEPPLVRATVVQDTEDYILQTQTSIAEGGSATVYIKRYYFDSTASLTVRLGNTNFTCYDPLRPGDTPRDHTAEEIPVATSNREITVTIPAGQDSTTAVVRTQDDHAAECGIRWNVDVLPPDRPEGVSETAWARRYDEWEYHPLHPNEAFVVMSDGDALPVISFTSPTVDEDAGTAEVVVTLRTEAISSGYNSSWPINLHWWTVEQTASEVVDFTKLEQQLVTFPVDTDGGQSDVSLRIPITDDHTVESTETLEIGYRISTSFNNNLALTRHGSTPTITIEDNDQIPTITAETALEVGESVGEAVIALTLDQPSDSPITVTWRTEDDTAKSGATPLDDDYDSTTAGSITFQPLATSAQIAVAINDDIWDEHTESFRVRLLSATNGVLGQTMTTVSIVDDDRPPVYTIRAPLGITEDAGVTSFTAVLWDPTTRQQAVSGKEISITVTPVDGAAHDASLPAATFESDYNVSTQMVTIRPGNSHANLGVWAIHDDLDEEAEFFTLSSHQFVNVRQSRLVNYDRVVRIRDIDPLPMLSVQDVTVSEPASATGTVTLTMTVMLSSPSAKPVAVDFRTRDGTAKFRPDGQPPTLGHADDYVSTSGTVSFAPRSASETIQITIKGDAYAEVDETFRLVLSSPRNAIIEDGNGVVTIQDMSPLPMIVLESYSPSQRVSEGVSSLRVVFTLNTADNSGLIVSGRTTTLRYSVIEYTPPEDSNNREAIRGTDYQLPSTGTITISPGNTKASLMIALIDDNLDEPREVVRLRFDNPSNATYGSMAENNVVIIDNDPRSRITIADASAREDAGTMSFNVSLNRASARDVSFRYNTQQGTAFLDEDFESTVGEVTIPAGQTTATIDVTILNDRDLETIQEVFTVFLSNPTNGILNRNVATGRIIDDDQMLPENQTTSIVVSATELEVMEGDASGASIDVSLSSAPSGTVIVTLSGLSGTGLTTTPSSLTFNEETWEDATALTFIAGSDDDASDDDETVVLKANGGGYIDVSREVLVTVDDDDTAAINVSNDLLAISEGESDAYTVTLASEPTGEVVVVMSKAATDPRDLASVELDAASLTFTTANWAAARTVTVEATQDDDAFNESITITMRGSGADYEGLSEFVVVSVDDDESIGLTLKDSEGEQLGNTPAVTLTERESTHVTVELASQPTDSVVVTASVARVGELTIDSDTTPGSKSLTFTPQTWQEPQRLDLVSVGDDDAVDGTPIPVAFAASGGDYDSLESPDLTVTVVDDDTAAIDVSVGSLEVDEGDASGESYTVKLATLPSATVTVTVSGHAGTDVSVSATSLTFTTANWDTAQTVTVTAAEDDDATDDTVTLSHAASGGDYSSVSAATVAVTVDDDETVGIDVSVLALEVDEGDAPGESYTVKLASLPSATVTVAVSGHSGTDVSVSATSLTFTTANWDTAQTVTVSAGQDADAVDDMVTLSHGASGGGYGDVRGGLPVTVVDDDTAAIDVSVGSLRVDEGDASGESYTVKLASLPSGSVTVAVSGHADSDVSVSATSLTFTTANWDTVQTVTVSAGQDADAVDDTVTLSHGASGGDYGSVSAVTVAVTVDDDETAAIDVSVGSLRVDEGDASGESYTVKLASLPSATVTVAVSGHSGTDVSVSATSLTFTTANWDTVQTVTVSAGQDADAVDDTVTLSHGASGGDYGSVSAVTVAVTVDDDDTVGIDVSTASLRVDEGDASGESYTVKLASLPSGSVTVTVTGHADSDVSVSATALTFTTANWDTMQTVTVTAGQDDDATDDTVTLSHGASGGDYSSVSAVTVAVTVDDDDTVGIDVSTASLRVDEGDASGESYTVRLGTLPSGSVTVTVSGHSGTDVSVSASSLTFTTANWDTMQTVTVSAGHDADAVDDTVTLSHGASGGDYSSVSAVTVAVTVDDDETAAIDVSVASLEVDEGDASGESYTVRLGTLPSGSVTVTVSGHSGTDVSVSASSLTFTTANWDTMQTVTVSAGHDADAVDDTVTLSHGASGGDYSSVSAVTVAVTVDDDETAAIDVSVASLEVDEGDASGESYTVRLGTLPSGSVTVTVSGHADSDVSVSATSLTFTTANWDTMQTVTVTAAHDADDTDDITNLGLSSNGGDYNNLFQILRVTVVDDDTAEIYSSTASLEVDEGDVSGEDYAVRLETQPSEAVTVIIDGSAGTSLSLSSTRLTFSTANWASAQTVTVNADEDDDHEDESIDLGLHGRGGSYNNLRKNLPVIVVDNDTAAIDVSVSSLEVDEGDASGESYTVRLDTLPSATVTVTVSGHASTDVSVSASSLTFTTANWDTVQTVTVSAGHDADATNDTVTLSHAASGGDYGSVDAVTVAVTVDDDDSAGIDVSTASLEVDEGDASGESYTVELATLPSATVTVTVSGHASTDVSVSASSLTFTTANWDTVQTVTVSAGHDADATNDTVTLSHAASGGDYGSVDAVTVAVTVDDDDSAGIDVSTASLEVDEGDASGESYTVELATLPSATVTVTVSGHASTDVSVSASSLTFTTANWDTVQTVTVSADHDADATNDTVTLSQRVGGVGRGLRVGGCGDGGGDCR